MTRCSLRVFLLELAYDMLISFLIDWILFVLLFQSFCFHFHSSFFPSDSKLAFIARLQIPYRVCLMA